ncbi:hypothetical protein ACQEVG_00925 [Streptomyces sp. CA-135486]|uniref:hypothetical protein n=1 Tax=Streptomyces sp. CA-135486 TaxID=3240049 RepID=UPI003D906D3F
MSCTRLASAAAFTVAAAVGATLVPLTAHAAPVGSGTPLIIELGAPAPAGDDAGHRDQTPDTEWNSCCVAVPLGQWS